MPVAAVILFPLAQLLVSSPAPPAAPVASPADVFQFPSPRWPPRCLDFGSQGRYCDGAALRSCAWGAVWLHPGVDIASGIQPIRAAGDGVIVGYMIDPTFHGGVLIRHRMTTGVVITQYWHVWLRSGFHVGSVVQRGQVIADVASMGSRTHFHFPGFKDDMESHAWNRALPPTPWSGFPAFPHQFVNPPAFIQAHLA